MNEGFQRCRKTQKSSNCLTVMFQPRLIPGGERVKNHRFFKWAINFMLMKSAGNMLAAHMELPKISKNIRNPFYIKGDINDTRWFPVVLFFFWGVAKIKNQFRKVFSPRKGGQQMYPWLHSRRLGNPAPKSGRTLGRSNAFKVRFICTLAPAWRIIP